MASTQVIIIDSLEGVSLFVGKKKRKKENGTGLQGRQHEEIETKNDGQVAYVDEA